jgi:tetratricopeptide (TPR) repeat protein
MTVVIPNQSLFADLKRMAPVLGIVLATALGVAVGVRFVAVGHLRAATAAHPNACRLAELHLAAAQQILPDLREEALKLATTQPAPNALGRLKGSEDVTKALAELRRAAELCPARAEVLQMLSVVEWYAGNEVGARVQLGMMLSAKQRHEEAEIQFRLAQAADPKNEAAARGLLLTFHRRDLRDKAAELATANEEILETSPDGRLALGMVLSSVGRFERGFSLLQQGLRERPADVEAMRFLCNTAKALGRPEVAGEFLMTLGEEERTVPDAYSMAAIMFREAKDLGREEKALRRAIRLAPNSAVLNYELSVNLWRQDRKIEARDAIRLAFEYSYPMTMELIAKSGIDPSKL